MEKNVYETEPVAHVIIRTSGNLKLRGWEEERISVKGPFSEDIDLVQDDDTLRVSSSSDLLVSLPGESLVTIESVEGSADLQNMDAAITIERVSGHLSLRNMAACQIGRIEGNLNAKNIEGSLELSVVNGNVALRDIEGGLSVEGVIEGSLTLKGLSAGSRAKVNGSIDLQFEPEAGEQYYFEAAGNLSCRLPSETDATISIERAGNLQIKLRNRENMARAEGAQTIVLGDGNAILNLAADGTLKLTNLPAEIEVDGLELDFGQDLDQLSQSINLQVSQQIDAQMEMLESQLEAQLSNLSALINRAGIAPEKAERIAERARQVSERASAKAQEKLARVHEKLERKLEAARRRAEMRARAAERSARDRRRRPETPFPPPFPPPPPTRKEEAVSDDERMLVLKMLEQQQITVEEAEQLLAALSGKNQTR